MGRAHGHHAINIGWFCERALGEYWGLSLRDPILSGMPTPPACYPLVFQPLLLEKVWGGDALALVGKRVASGARVGESWELADLASTSAGGAGGGAARSVIRDGSMAGKTLHQAIGAWGPALMGDIVPTASGGFPLLIKFLDARENLSVQVHPSPAYCRMHPDAHLKTECWYILHAKPGAKIYKGVKPGVSKQEFAEALADGDGRGVLDLIEAVDAIAGECHNLPSGTVHALGAGVLVAEVQTPSDTTFRVYDWGRKGRELHVQQSLACIQWEQARDATRGKVGQATSRLVTTGYFDLDEMRVAQGESIAIGDGNAPNRPVVLMAVSSSGRLVDANDAFEPVAVSRGDTVLVPAALAATTTFVCGEAGVLLRATPRA
jgi:mannose-6-phosphate isomerase